jgi:hypothetical protein
MTWAVERVDADAMEEARERVMVEICVDEPAREL